MIGVSRRTIFKWKAAGRLDPAWQAVQHTGPKPQYLFRVADILALGQTVNSAARELGSHQSRLPSPEDAAALLAIRARARTRTAGLLRQDTPQPPGAVAMNDHVIRLIDRLLRGTAHRDEVLSLADASLEFAKWWEEHTGADPRAEVRPGEIDLLRRLAEDLPPPPPDAPDAP